MPFTPEQLGADARRRLERVFIVSVVVLTVAGMLLPGGPAAAQSARDFVNYFMLGVATLLEWILIFTGKLVVLLVDAVISVAQFNTFTKAQPVQAGWPLVRDVVNMFFIVILLVTAFSTIIQYHKFDYRKILPKLLLMAVLVNFSKTLIGLLIDFSQILMLTFVNGFKAAAAGNFVQALKLDKVLSLANEQVRADAEATVKNPQLVNIILAEMLGIFMVGTSAVMLLIMLIYLIARIVGLWIALIMSPAAFFASALDSTPLSGTVALITKGFWGKLGAMLSGGPIMAFFLWLTLATVQNGGFDFKTVVTSEARQTEAADEQISYFSSKVGNAQEVATFLVAVVMLLMGVEAAVSIAGQVSSGVGKAVGRVKDVGMRATRFAAYGGLAAAGAAGVRAGARRVDTGFNITAGLGQGLQQIGSKTPAFLGGAAIMGAGGALRTINRKQVKAQEKDLDTRLAGMSDREKLDYLSRGNRGESSIDNRARQIKRAQFERTKGAREEIKKDLETDAKKRGLDGDDAKAFVEKESRQQYADRLEELKKLATDTGDDELKKLYKEGSEELDKRPDYIMDDAKVDEKIRGMDVGQAGHMSVEAWQDTRVVDAALRNFQMLNADGTLNEDNDAYKSLVKKGGARGSMIRERAAAIQQEMTAKGTSTSEVLANSGKDGGLSHGFYVAGKDRDASGRTSWKFVDNTRLRKDSTSASRTTTSDSDRINAVQRQVAQARARGAAGKTDLGNAQFEGIKSGVAPAALFNVSKTGAFAAPEDRDDFVNATQRMAREGQSDPSVYRKFNVAGLKSNAPNEARATFAATANLDHMAQAYNRSDTDKEARAGITSAVDLIHSEGSRVQQQLVDYNKGRKDPSEHINISRVQQLVNSGDTAGAMRELGDHSYVLSADEVKALGQKHLIDTGPLAPLRSTGSARAAGAAASAGTPPSTP